MAQNMLELCDGNTLLEQSIKQLQNLLAPPDSRYDTRGTPERLKLGSFVEATSKLLLEPWQHHMCRRLEKLTHQKGQRILIHKPPQHGGSIVVSQRLPAYLIGDNPAVRVKLAGFNIDHSTGFCAINKMIMQSPEYLQMFPEADTRIPNKCSDEQFSTRARRSFRDGQHSLKALGLLTGFVGQGAEHLIIDDPYASPQAAMSKAIQESVWDFWTKGASVRIDENSNVIIMFHRYHEDDFVGQLIQEEGLQPNGGVWELISYRAEWDGDTRVEVGGLDPLRRRVGEYLSPRLAKQPGYYRGKKRNVSVWLSQFQGKPSKAEGNMFEVKNMRVISRIPHGVQIVRICRAWDIASSEDGDWTAGVLMALGSDGYVYVMHTVRIRKNTDARNKVIRFTARDDRRKFGRDVIIRFPQDPNAAGKDLIVSLQKLLIGFEIKSEITSGKGNKEQRADPWSQYVNSGLVRLVYNGDIWEKDENDEYVSWIPDFIEEHRRFPGGPTTKKDQVDAASDGFGEIALEIDEPAGEDFDTLGISGEEVDTTGRRVLVTEETQEDLLNELRAMGYYGYNNETEEELESNGNNASDNYRKAYTRRDTSSIAGTLKLSTRRERRERTLAKEATSRRHAIKRSNRNRSTRSV